MAEQWTPETRQLVAESLHAQRCDCGSVSEEDLDDADTALTALADTGLLVTPQMRAVLRTAGALVGDWRIGRSTHGGRLIDAVEALGTPATSDAEP